MDFMRVPVCEGSRALWISRECWYVRVGEWRGVVELHENTGK